MTEEEETGEKIFEIGDHNYTKDDLNTIIGTTLNIIKKYDKNIYNNFPRIMKKEGVKTFITKKFVDNSDKYKDITGKIRANKNDETTIRNLHFIKGVINKYGGKEDFQKTIGDEEYKIFLNNADILNNFFKTYNINKIITEAEENEKRAKQQQQQHEQEIEQQQQQHEQEMKQQQQQHEQYNAERNRIENERNANIKNKAYEEGKEEGSKHSVEEIRKILAEDRRIEAERNQAQKDYIMSKVRDGIYKLPKQKIVEIVKKDIEDKKITTDDPEKMADTIYWESVKFINKHKRTIARLSTMQGYNPTQFEQLPPTVHQAVNDYIQDKWEEDIARKNRKYLLPKDLPRWERAVQQHNVNPMLGRGAWSN